MKCAYCGLLLPPTLFIKHCPRCNGVIVGQEELVETREERGITFADVMKYVGTKIFFLLIGLCVLQLTLFCALAWWVHLHPTWFLDVVVTHELQRRQAVGISATMQLVSQLGNIPHLLIAIVVGAAVLLWIMRYRLEAALIVGVFEASSVLNSLLKSLVNRPRPTAPTVRIIEVAGGTSFPSGHVMSYVAFWGMLFVFCVFVFKLKRWWHHVLAALSGLFVALIGPSRVYLGDHWATDVLGAYLFEGGLICLALLIYLKLKDMLPQFHLLWRQGIRKVTGSGT